MTLTIIEWIGAAFAITGAYLTASTSRAQRRVGFITYMIANAAIIIVASAGRNWGITTMTAVFVLTSARGWWNNRPES